MRILDFIGELSNPCYSGDTNLNISGAQIHSGLIKPGDMFVALPGKNVDGHDFLQDAKNNGAVLALVAKKQALEIPQIVVPDPIQAFGQIAKCWRQKFSPICFAITGSYGKTTTKEFLSSILSQHNKVLSPQKSYNNFLGVPLTLFKLQQDHKYLVLELGADKVNEIDYLQKLVMPEYAAVTSVAPVHLTTFGSFENILTTKAQIFNGFRLRKGFYPINTNYSEYLLNKLKNKAVSFSLTEPADYIATDIICSNQKIIFSLYNSNQKLADIQLNYLGKHNVYNALIAAAMSLESGIPIECVVAGIEQTKPVEGRLYPYHLKDNICLIDDSYNANPNAVIAAIDVLSSMQGEKILVLGDMLSLGDSSKSQHENIAQVAKHKGIDQLYTFGDAAKWAHEAFNGSGGHFSDHTLLSKTLLKTLQTPANVLVKGSNAMQMNKVVDYIKTTLGYEN